MVMRAFALDELGAAGSVHQLPIPEPEEGEILIAVHAAAVNAVDPMYASGMFKDYMEHRLPLVLGLDFAGVVERRGPQVDGLSIGDAVYGIAAKPFVGAGTFAESVTAGADDTAPKPASLDFTEAASVPTAGLTALAAIEAVDPRPGQVIVLHGATGGVGSFAAQLAAARGATVVAVTAGGGAAQARDYGAAETIDYESGSVAEELRTRYPAGVDAVISTHRDLESVVAIAEAMRKGGLVVSPAIRAEDGAAALQPLGVTFKSANRLAPSRLPELTALIDAGQLRVPPITVYKLEATADALAAMATGHVRGKLVIRIR